MRDHSFRAGGLVAVSENRTEIRWGKPKTVDHGCERGQVGPQVVERPGRDTVPGEIPVPGFYRVRWSRPEWTFFVSIYGVFKHRWSGHCRIAVMSWNRLQEMIIADDAAANLFLS
jgi:hypothetical protein